MCVMCMCVVYVVCKRKGVILHFTATIKKEAKMFKKKMFGVDGWWCCGVVNSINNSRKLSVDILSHNFSQMIEVDMSV